GIIEDAHLGKGLGHRFLKHIERNAVLLFMVPADTDHIGNEYNVLLHELEMFNEELLDKPRILAVTKSDMIDDELKEMLKSDLPPGIKTVFISSVTNKGLKELKDMLWQELNPVQE
ncbi:MAG TPA: GTPase ObgE, partial [Saprospiraceae bacterium]|nr:GTPase ObgE [Saprospiraceae bacterium]